MSLKDWIFIGMCKCPINNPKDKATHTQDNCPLHGKNKE